MKEVIQECTYIVTRYEATDGRIFDSEEECLAYERSQSMTKQQALNRMQHMTEKRMRLFCGDENKSYCWYRIGCQEDLDALIKYYGLDGCMVPNFKLDYNSDPTWVLISVNSDDKAYFEGDIYGYERYVRRNFAELGFEVSFIAI